MNPGPDWRIWFGLVFTVGWLLIGALYVAQGQGWRFFTQPADVIGNLPTSSAASWREHTGVHIDF